MRIKAKRVKKQTANATPSTCGDGWVDAGSGETCDASAADGDAACPFACLPPEDAAACTCDPLVVTTGLGTLQGVRRDGARNFLGIPYAAPPVGDLRWRSPQPPTPWTGVRDATTPGDVCPHVVPTIGVPTGSEDCLFVNVHAPDPPPEEPLPVMVWIHGGGYTVGDSLSFGMTDGAVLAARAGVVVVSLNYRLAQFGFLAHADLSAEDPAHPTSGNYAVEDQAAALRWVREHVAPFGGDPTNVTIFGESAGGWSVCTMLASPLAEGLFDRAIIQSGPCTTPIPTLAAAETQGERFADEIGCAGAPDVVACMRSKTLDEVRSTVAPPDPLALFDLPEARYWGPVDDGVVLPEQLGDAFAAGRFHQVPVLAGSTRDEGTVFAIFAHDARGMPLTADLYDDRLMFLLRDQTLTDTVVAQYPLANFPSPTLAFSEAFGDGFLACPSIETANLVSAHVPTYLYQFEFPDAQFSLPSPLPLGRLPLRRDPVRLRPAHHRRLHTARR